MADRVEWMIYGANGYTGHLVAVEARRQGLHPVLAGRRSGPIETLAAELSLPARVFDLGDAQSATAALVDMAVVAHCAGPFAATSAQMIDACLTSRTHYLDITGELDVFLAAQRRDADAQAAGIVICPGVGFDVIPTDCLASVLNEALPDATQLILAFDAGAHVSPGTARTMAESFRLGRRGGRVRRNGVIEEVPLAHSRRSIEFAGGSAMTVAIAWGDLRSDWVAAFRRNRWPPCFGFRRQIIETPRTGRTRGSKAGILYNEHIAEDRPTVFAHACRLESKLAKLGRGFRRGGHALAILAQQRRAIEP